MRYLLHCIFQQTPDDPPPDPGLRVVAEHGLAVLVSQLKMTSSVPGVSSLLAYAKAIEAIHARQAVIPLRYGCLMDSEDEIVCLLGDRRQEYEAMLDRFQGMTEMGIRVLSPVRAGFLPGLPASPGARYLASLQNRWKCAAALAPDEARLADEIAGALSSCSTEQRREVSSSHQGRLVSLYFLTPKAWAEQFLQRARQVRPPAGAKLLLSGPWPPYNFVGSLG